MPYAAIHQLGGKAGRGHKVTIPVRPYLALDRGTEMELAEKDRQIVIELIRKRLLSSSWIPTYWKINWYEHNFVAQDFVDLAKVLAGIKARADF